MRNIIKNLLREYLLNEIGTAEPVHFTYTDDEDDTEEIPELNGSFYKFNVSDENIKANFKLIKINTYNGVKYYTYDFIFVSNSEYSSTNNIKTLFTKLMTLKSIVSNFIDRYKRDIENNQNKLYQINIIGIGNKDKGENPQEETQRTRLYDYFINRYKPVDFDYIKKNNLLILKRKFN